LGWIVHGPCQATVDMADQPSWHIRDPVESNPVVFFGALFYGMFEDVQSRRAALGCKGQAGWSSHAIAGALVELAKLGAQ
jgi:hypothetical protein